MFPFAAPVIYGGVENALKAGSNLSASADAFGGDLVQKGDGAQVGEVLFLSAFEFLLDGFRFGDVLAETAAVEKFVSFAIHAGTEGDIADGTVLVPNAGFAITEGLALGEAVENVGDNVRIGMEFANVMADVFFGRVTEEIEFGFVGPKDFARQGDLMNAFHSAFKEVGKLRSRRARTFSSSRRCPISACKAAARCWS